MTESKILVIEDDQTVNDLLCENLSRLGYTVSHAYDGERGLNLALDDEYEIILLDVMMPKLDGFDVLQSLRQHKSSPVLMLTAKGAEEDRITGFKTGADDYLTKPFSMTELELRIKAILRRTGQQVKPPITNTHNSIQFDKQSGQITILQQKIAFTPIEFDLLFSLASEQGDVLSKAYLYQSVLLREFSRYDRTLDMHISKIRKKITLAGMPVNTIKTVRGQGYCFEAL
jgi:two-component system response regulator PfeR